MTGAVDVVIPTYNARGLITRCLEALDDPALARVTVVDDASTDGTAEEITRRFPAVSVVELPEHRGLAYALNRGADAGEAELVLFLNNDVFPRPGAASRLAEALAEDPDAAAAGGRLVDPGTDHTQDVYRPRAIPGLSALVVRLTGVELLWPRNPWTGQHVREPLDEHTIAAIDQQLPGACLLVRRRVLEAVGGWDEGYWVWYEDVDLARRLLRLGHALYVPDAVFDHLGNASTSHWERPERHRRLYHGTMRYGEAHLGRLQAALLGLVVVAVTAPRVLAFSRRRPEAAGAYREILRGGVALVLGWAIRAPRALRRSACCR